MFEGKCITGFCCRGVTVKSPNIFRHKPYQEETYMFNEKNELRKYPFECVLLVLMQGTIDKKNRVSAKLFIDWFWSKIMSFVFVSGIVEVLKLKIETTFLLESQQMQGWAKSYIAMTCKSANCKFSNYSINTLQMFWAHYASMFHSCTEHS